MTTGTKIFLALFALIVGILVVYYGMVMPRNGAESGAQPMMADGLNPDRPREPSEGAPQAAARTEAQPRTAPPPRNPAPLAAQSNPPLTTLPMNASPGGGLLSEGVSEATGDPVQPIVTASKPPAAGNPYLPLVGLNNGDLRSSADDAPTGEVEADQTHVEPSTADSQQPAESDPAASDPQPMEPMPERSPLSAPPPSRPETEASSRIQYVIAQGDTFVSIANDWFGDGNKWSLIAKENPTVDPQRLKIGQKIFLPPKAAANATARPDPTLSSGETMYVVQSGDTLIAIARDRLGDGARWESIYQLNKAAIGDDAATLKVGMKLKLPKK